GVSLPESAAEPGSKTPTGEFLLGRLLQLFRSAHSWQSRYFGAADYAPHRQIYRPMPHRKMIALCSTALLAWLAAVQPLPKACFQFPARAATSFPRYKKVFARDCAPSFFPSLHLFEPLPWLL